MSITNTSNLGPMILQTIAPGMLYTPTPGFNYILPASKVSSRARSGTTMRFYRRRLFDPPTIQLGNSGIDPAPQVPQRDIIDAQMSFFGTGCVINEQVLIQDQDAVLSWTAEGLMVSGRQAEDIILRDYLTSSASQISCSGGSNADSPTEISVADVSLVGATLDTNNAMKFTAGILGEDRFGSGPVRSSYFMLSSTEIQTDFDRLLGSGFKSQWDYPNNSNALASEYGNILNFRILVSSQAAVSRNVSMNGRDLYYNVCTGKQGYTHIDQDEYSMKLLYRGPEFSGYLGQNVTLGIKFSQAQALTQDTAVRVLLSTRFI